MEASHLITAMPDAPARDSPSPPSSSSSSTTTAGATTLQEHLSLALAIRRLPSASLRYLIEEMQAADAGASALAAVLIDEAFPARVKDPRYPLRPSIWQLGYADLRELALGLCLEPGGKAAALAQIDRVRLGKDGHGRYLYDVAREKEERERQKQLQKGSAAAAAGSETSSSSGPTSPTTPDVDGGAAQVHEQEDKKKLGKREKIKRWWTEVLLSQEFALGGPYYQAYS